jgi:hypothetical protein
VYVACPGEVYPQVTVVDTPNISVPNGATSINHIGAGFFLAAQHCLNYLSTFQTPAQTDWIGFDGFGAKSVPILLVDDPKHRLQLPYFKNDAVSFRADEYDLQGASTEALCHEIAHGVWDNLPTGKVPNGVEAVALNEGFGDVIGSVAEMAQRGYPGEGGWCFAGDDYLNNTCLRDFVNPDQSVECPMVDKSTCPSDYGTPDYCTYNVRCDPDHGILTNCCDVHHNATVLDHWFYIVSKGDSGINSDNCDYSVQPMNSDLKTSVTQTSQVLFSALRDYRFNVNSGYEGLADATISAAKATFGADSQQVRSIVGGWYAVNVKEDYVEDSKEVQPVRNLFKANPWMVFKWPTHPGETSWDIQVSTGPFDAAHLLYDRQEVYWTDAFSDDPKHYPRFDASLPFDSDKRFYWRTRPHSTEPWEDCYPIHSFNGTRSPDPIRGLTVGGADASGQVHPGPVKLLWREVEGASYYDVLIATHDLDCEAAPDAISDYAAANERNKLVVLTTKDAAQPNQHYWVNVRASSLMNPDKTKSRGGCYKAQFTTGGVRAPTLTEPNFTLHNYKTWDDVTFRWHSYDGISNYALELFEIDEKGNCETQPASSDSFRYECTETECDFVLEAKDKKLDATGHYTNEYVLKNMHALNPLNASGYCWRLRGTTDDGTTDVVSDKGKISFVHEVSQTAPGVRLASFLLNGVTSRLPGGPNTYGDDVEFSWSADPQAYGYVLKLGLYPWETALSTPDPTNCWDVAGCKKDSWKVTYDDIVRGTRVVLPGEVAGKGRYCWRVFPVLKKPGTNLPWDRQPLVDSDILCYTSGPSEPRIIVTNPPPKEGFDPRVIRGTVELDYAPNNQVYLDPSEGVVFPVPVCDKTGPYVKDIYNCKLPFEIQPQEGKSYSIHVRTYNSDQGPKPVMDDASKVHDITREIRVGSCGARGELCCAQGKCDGGSLNCVDNRCAACGHEGQDCCGDVCTDGSACQGGKCQHCGGAYEPCCSGGCSEPGFDCNGGYCQQKEQCNDTVYSGGDKAETHTIELGRNTGTVLFGATLWDVPDDIQVWYEGKVIFDTACYGTDSEDFMTGNRVNVNCSLGYCSGQFTLNGRSTQVTVTVNPNCDRASETTRWEFLVQCPMTL